ncbi:hypothetical protein GGR54DRAFT_319229 [Hypoxylon sp. NC1633]|nr:hypothetical protein GGR54DRAFT_319229 [Hypoxylon sp. NC1633]
MCPRVSCSQTPLPTPTPSSTSTLTAPTAITITITTTITIVAITIATATAISTDSSSSSTTGSSASTPPTCLADRVPRARGHPRLKPLHQHHRVHALVAREPQAGRGWPASRCGPRSRCVRVQDALAGSPACVIVVRGLTDRVDLRRRVYCCLVGRNRTCWLVGSASDR